MEGHQTNKKAYTPTTSIHACWCMPAKEVSYPDDWAFLLLLARPVLALAKGISVLLMNEWPTSNAFCRHLTYKHHIHTWTSSQRQKQTCRNSTCEWAMTLQATRSFPQALGPWLCKAVVAVACCVKCYATTATLVATVLVLTLVWQLRRMCNRLNNLDILLYYV